MIKRFIIILMVVFSCGLAMGQSNYLSTNYSTYEYDYSLGEYTITSTVVSTVNIIVDEYRSNIFFETSIEVDMHRIKYKESEGGVNKYKYITTDWVDKEYLIVLDINNLEIRVSRYGVRFPPIYCYYINE